MSESSDFTYIKNERKNHISDKQHQKKKRNTYSKSKIIVTFIKSSSKEAASAYLPNSAEVTAAPYNAPNICSEFHTNPKLKISTISPSLTHSIQRHYFTQVIGPALQKKLITGNPLQVTLIRNKAFSLN